ncbi:MAG: dihydrodipicolinate synthase family protein [Alphaproteobacteria bacterium]|jgi:4-hydroxy-tetrahydrodipicolinate synthase|nr:dihydrodipicolinate synthase family protein [Alphaproteobacteria bacterium]
MSNTLRGVWTAALTPQNQDLSVNLEHLVAHYRWLLAGGSDGIAVLGTTGEANSFSVAERRAVIGRVAEAGFANDEIMIGTGCCAFPDTVELTRAALDAGYANILMLPPFYYKGVSDDGLFAAYANVIERVADSSMRIYVYDFPKMTGLEIDADLLVRLHDAFPDTIVGIKDSSGRWPDMKEVAERIPGFGTFAGTEQYLLPVLRAGGAGCISATANVTCGIAAALYRAWKSDEADALQERVSQVRATLEAYPTVPALKELMAAHTGRAGWRQARPPMVPLSAEAREALFRDLEAIGFVLPEAA